jgi:hypothetical protein
MEMSVHESIYFQIDSVTAEAEEIICAWPHVVNLLVCYGFSC